MHKYIIYIGKINTIIMILTILYLYKCANTLNITKNITR